MFQICSTDSIIFLQGTFSMISPINLYYQILR